MAGGQDRIDHAVDVSGQDAPGLRFVFAFATGAGGNSCVSDHQVERCHRIAGADPGGKARAVENVDGLGVNLGTACRAYLCHRSEAPGVSPG